MNEAAEYRANAEICRRMADKAQNEQDKRAWLEMAQSWSFLTTLEDVVPFDERKDPRALDTNWLSAIVQGKKNRYSRILIGIFGVVRTRLEAALSSILRGSKSLQERSTSWLRGSFEQRSNLRRRRKGLALRRLQISTTGSPRSPISAGWRQWRRPIGRCAPSVVRKNLVQNGLPS
jgi:hypothetical protein